MGEGITKATVACWHSRPGQDVNAGDEIVEVVTDKATFLIEAPAKGRLSSILVGQGQETPIGTVLGTIE